jgi:hypothetical protein
VGWLDVGGPAVESIALPSLVEATGAGLVNPDGLVIDENPVLSSVDLSSLAVVHGQLDLSVNPLWCQPEVDAIVAGVTVVDGAVLTNGNNTGPDCGSVAPTEDPPLEPVDPDVPVDPAGDEEVVREAEGCATARGAPGLLWLLAAARLRRPRRPETR